MKVIVDTNIVFSALVHSESRIADLLLNSGNTFEFYSCYLLQEELHRHQDRLLDYSGMTGEQLAIAVSSCTFFFIILEKALTHRLCQQQPRNTMHESQI